MAVDPEERKSLEAAKDKAEKGLTPQDEVIKQIEGRLALLQEAKKQAAAALQLAEKLAAMPDDDIT